MGNIFSELKNFLIPKIEKRILMVGLDRSGKTTLLYKLLLQDYISSIPTIGFNVESIELKNQKLVIWDIGGRKQIRPLWVHYLQNTSILFFVIDAADRNRIDQAKQQLEKLLLQQFSQVPIFILANKQDIQDSMQVEQIIHRLELQNWVNKNWLIQGISNKTGEGINQFLDRLATVPCKFQENKVDFSEIVDLFIENFVYLIKKIKKIFKKIKNSFKKKKIQKTVLMLGLDESGKTTILYKLKTGETVQTIPTIGFNQEDIKYKNLKLSIIDVGGQERVRKDWKQYYQYASALIFVVDSQNRDHVLKAREQLQILLRAQELRNSGILILANKSDLENRTTAQELIEIFGLSEIEQRFWTIIEVCGISGEGLNDGLNWLHEVLRRDNSY